MDADAAIALIQRHGFDGLAGLEGCVCCSFSVHGVDVAVSCRKSNTIEPGAPTVRVSSKHLDSLDERPALERVAKLVAEQVAERVGCEPAIVVTP